jgi:hypothetical protein
MCFVLNWISQPCSFGAGETAMMPTFSTRMSSCQNGILWRRIRAHGEYLEGREVRLQWI